MTIANLLYGVRRESACGVNRALVKIGPFKMLAHWSKPSIRGFSASRDNANTHRIVPLRGSSNRLNTGCQPDVEARGSASYVTGPYMMTITSVGRLPLRRTPPDGPNGAAIRTTDGAVPHTVTGGAPPTATGTAGVKISAQDKIRGYVALMKLRIVELLLITTVPTMILAADGWPGWKLVILTLIGGTGAAGAANAWNMIYDRDIDAVMNRTKNRPLVTGVLTPREATVFATALTIGSLAWFGFLVNWVAAAFTAAALAIYAIAYTVILKRRTPQNIVWGGSAGALPVVIGWSAVTGGLDWPPVILFLVIFFWTPPHYWPLSMKFKKDYAAAGVPMAPVVQKSTTVAWHMIVHTAAMVAATLALIPVAGMGWIYTISAAGAGAWFLGSVIRLYVRAKHPEKGPLAAMQVFHGSIYYLTIVFVAVGLDPFGPSLPWL